MSSTAERIPRARSFPEVCRGFLRCREARVTALSLLAIWVAAALWGAAHFLVPVIVVAGFLLWYLIEIPIHRWILHMPLPRNDFGRRLMQRLHYTHHERPTDPRYLFLPEWLALPSIGIILGAAWLVGIPREGLWFLAGFWTSLTVYEWMHYAVHSRWRPDWAPVRRAFENHMRHHFRNEGYWFGVSNPFMDRLWGTAPEMDEVEQSAFVRNLHGTGGGADHE